MIKKIVDQKKHKYLNDLLGQYKKEIDTIFAISASWPLLKEAAQDVCANDFDKALIARESLLEELFDLQSGGFDVLDLTAALNLVDFALLGQKQNIKNLFGLDAAAYIRGS